MSDTPEPTNIPFAQPPEPPPGLNPDGNEKQFALFVHLSALLGFLVPLANLIAPFILWQVKKNESAFVDDQGKEAVNFQITLTLAAIVLGVVGLPLMLFTLGFAGIIVIPAGLALLIAGVVLPILAGIKANEGIAYRYPYILRLIK